MPSCYGVRTKDKKPEKAAAVRLRRTGEKAEKPENQKAEKPKGRKAECQES